MNNPDIALFIAGALLLLLSIAHSYLGERYLLIRLFRREDLPRLFGGTEFTTRTLRFAWHLTSIAWVGFAGVLFVLDADSASSRPVLWLIAVTFLTHAGLTLFASRGRHLAWPVFLLVALLAGYGALASVGSPG